MPSSKYCVFPYCGNYGRNEKAKGFFNFPQKEPKRSEWIDICALQNTQLPRKPFICHLHFDKEDLNLDNPNRVTLKFWAKPLAPPFHNYIAAYEEILNPDICDDKYNLKGREPK